MISQIRSVILLYMVLLISTMALNNTSMIDAQIAPETYIAWSPDGQLISVAQDYSVFIVDATNGDVLNIITDLDLQFSPARWSADSSLLAIANGTETQIWSQAWDPINVSTNLTLPSSGGYPWIVAWNPIDQRIAIGEVERVFVYLDGDLLYSVDHNSSLSDIGWSNNGTYLVTSGGTGVAGEVRIWDGSDGEFTYNIRIDTQLLPPDHTASGSSVSWSPDDTQLIIGCDDGIGRIWNITNATPISTARFAFSNNNSTITTVDWHPNGLWIASSSWDGAIRIRDATTFEVLETIQTSNPVHSIEWSPDGSQLAYGDPETLVTVIIPDVLAESTPEPEGQ